MTSNLTHRQRMMGVTIVAPDRTEEIAKLQSALSRISEAAKDSARLMDEVARDIEKNAPWKYRDLAKAFRNTKTHFTYIQDIAKEATNDK